VFENVELTSARKYKNDGVITLKILIKRSQFSTRRLLVCSREAKVCDNDFHELCGTVLDSNKISS